MVTVKLVPHVGLISIGQSVLPAFCLQNSLNAMWEALQKSGSRKWTSG